MRLGYIYSVLLEAVNNLIFTSEEEFFDNSVLLKSKEDIHITLLSLRYLNIKPINEAVEKIDDFMSSNKEIKVITLRNIISIPKECSDEFGALIDILLRTCLAFTSFISKSLDAESDAVVYVKIPKTKDIDIFIKHVSDVKQILAPSVEAGGEITLKGFDVGSEWIAISLVVYPAINILAACIWGAVALAKTQIELDKSHQLMQSVKVRNELAEEYKIGIREHLKLLSESHAQDIANGHLEDHNPESIRRIQHSMRLIQSLIKENGEFQLSAAAPKEIQANFPKPNIPLLNQAAPQKCLPAPKDASPPSDEDPSDGE